MSSQLRTFDFLTLDVGNIFISAVSMIPLSLSLFCFYLYLLTFGCVLAFVAAHGPPLVASADVWASSLWWLLSLQSTCTRMLGLSSCGAQILVVPWHMESSWTGVEPVCPGTGGQILKLWPAVKSDPYPYVYASNKHVHNETDSWTVYFFLKNPSDWLPIIQSFLASLTNLLTSVDTKLLPTVDSTFHSETRTIVPAYSF